MIGFDLFSGAGGMSVGAEWAGIKVAVAIENDSRAAATYRLNHPKTQLIEEGVEVVKSFSNVPSDQPLVVFGGPPCQGFSTSNQRTRTRENPRNWLFKEYIRIIQLLEPDWVVFENVTGILDTAGGFFAQQVTNSFVELGYTVSSFVLNAKHYGVPQNRSRYFAVASKHGVRLEPPERLDGMIHVRDAFEDLPSLAPGASTCELPYKRKAGSQYAQTLRGHAKTCHNNLVSANNAAVLARYAHIPQGGNWENIPLELMSNYSDVSGCHTGIYKRLKEDEPSIVIGNYRKNMLIHPLEDRGLSVREAARLQSFPDSFIFRGSIGFQQQQVGNAVPPLLAKAVFDKLSQTVGLCP